MLTERGGGGGVELSQPGRTVGRQEWSMIGYTTSFVSDLPFSNHHEFERIVCLFQPASHRGNSSSRFSKSPHEQMCREFINLTYPPRVATPLLLLAVQKRKKERKKKVQNALRSGEALHIPPNPYVPLRPRLADIPAKHGRTIRPSASHKLCLVIDHRASHFSPLFLEEQVVT